MPSALDIYRSAQLLITRHGAVLLLPLLSVPTAAMTAAIATAFMSGAKSWRPLTN